MNLENSIRVLTQYLDELKVNVTPATVQRCLLDHPNYPSLLSYIDCLNEWKIPNRAVKIKSAEYRPDRFSFPFVAHLQIPTSSFVVLHNISNGVVSLSDEHGNTEMSEQEFLKKWDGIILFATPGKDSGETNYRASKTGAVLKKLRYPALITIICGLICLGIDRYYLSASFALLFAIKTGGIFITVGLVAKSISSSSPFVENICSLGGIGNCNAILTSASAKITEWLSWSEVGLFYFSGSFLILVILPQAVPLLAIFNLLCLPYTVYSLVFQYRANNWCILCCCVQALLWMEFFVCAMYYHYYVFQLTFLNVIEFFLLFLLPIVLWAMIKEPLIESSQIEPLKKELNQFKFDMERFNQQLLSQPKYAVTDDLHPITLGNVNSKNVITIVSNPFCSPCARAHEKLDKLISQRDDVLIKVIFAAPDSNDSLKAKMSKHFVALNRLGDTKTVEKALSEWYNDPIKDYVGFKKKFPVIVDDECSVIITRQKEWCAMVEIKGTPTILFNGYKLPRLYDAGDLKYLLS